MKGDGVAASTATNENGAQQRRLIDFHSVSISIKSFGVCAAIRLLDGVIWLLDVLIAFREMVTHER